VGRIANEQRDVFHGNIEAVTKLFQDKNRQGLLRQIQDVGVTAQTERGELKKLVQQGF